MKKSYCKLTIILLLALLCLSGNAVVEGGILPSLIDTVGVAMPSLCEALHRYPDSETINADGSITELYTNVSESDFNAFSVYLQQQEAELADYNVEKGVLTAEIRAKGTFFSLQYDSKAGEAKVTYPSGTYDEWMKIAKTFFNSGRELLEAGNVEEALVEFLSIPQYSEYGPVAVLLQEDDNLAAAAARQEKLVPYRKTGNVVTFGAYPQTKGGKDKTPIEWIVLDYDETNHKVLLLSKYGLDAVPYFNRSFTNITWKQCTLRTWLNGEFLKKAFSKKEQSAILITNVDNSSDQSYSKWRTNGGDNTQDKIFLLSYAEANRYLGVTYDDSDNTKSRVAPTAYAIAKGAYISDSYQTEDGKLAGWWWLRSPGTLQNNASYVSGGGSLSCGDLNYDGRVVRPAFWLNLESDIF